MNIREYYFTNILKQSSLVNLQIESLYNKYGLFDNNYISVHIRCGDINMSNGTQNYLDKRVPFG